MVEILLIGDGHIVCIFGGTASNQSVKSVHLGREPRPWKRHFTYVRVTEAACQDRKYTEYCAKWPSPIFNNTSKWSRDRFEIKRQR